MASLSQNTHTLEHTQSYQSPPRLQQLGRHKRSQVCLNSSLWQILKTVARKQLVPNSEPQLHVEEMHFLFFVLRFIPELIRSTLHVPNVIKNAPKLPLWMHKTLMKCPTAYSWWPPVSPPPPPLSLKHPESTTASMYLSTCGPRSGERGAMANPGAPIF